MISSVANINAWPIHMHLIYMITRGIMMLILLVGQIPLVTSVAVTMKLLLTLCLETKFWS